MHPTQSFRRTELLRGLIQKVHNLKTLPPITLMEVCGTHTMALHRAGLQALWPEPVRLVAGPGCPVCVTPRDYLDRAMAMARTHRVLLTTFGDMVLVPGRKGTLADLRSTGHGVEVVYSPLDALRLAREHPEEDVVFLAVGFETTAPAVAAVLLQAYDEGVGNFSVLSALKTMPPVLKELVATDDLSIDGFLLPGHVSMVLGSQPFAFLAEEHEKACVIAGFEPADILQAVLLAADKIQRQNYGVEIQYRRAVRPEGNVRAREVMLTAFEPADTEWRGFGVLPASGLVPRREFEALDASKRFPVTVEPSPEPEGCRCGEVLRGLMGPMSCPLFDKACTPEDPVGACMVSSEGSCAAYYTYSWSR
jgi:hydrogenase expression/formation protein HypD